MRGQRLQEAEQANEALRSSRAKDLDGLIDALCRTIEATEYETGSPSWPEH